MKDQDRCLAEKGVYTFFTYDVRPIGVPAEYAKTETGSHHAIKEIKQDTILRRLKKSWGICYVITNVVVTGSRPSGYRVFKSDFNG